MKLFTATHDDHQVTIKFTAFSQLQTFEKYGRNMMTKLKLNYFCLSVKFLFFNLKLLGLAPYNFDSKTRKLRTGYKSFIHLMASVIIWFAFFGSLFYDILMTGLNFGSRSNILDKIWEELLLLEYFLACVTIIYNFPKRQHIENFLNLIFNFDDTLTRLRWSRPNANSEFSVFIVIIASTLFLVIYSVLTFTLEKGLYDIHRYIKLINFVSMHLFYLMLSMQFMLGCYCILTRLKVLLKMFR